MKKLVALGLAFALSLAFAGPVSAQIRIGVGGPMTGGSAAFGARYSFPLLESDFSGIVGGAIGALADGETAAR